MVVRGSACRAAICTSRRLTPGVEHRGDVRVAEHVRMHPRDLDSRGVGQLLHPAGGRVPVHPGAVWVAQDRPALAAVDGSVDRSGYRWA
jgi:murein DD-endopeptidase MepM/ murein hydrolase activator NlpD